MINSEWVRLSSGEDEILISTAMGQAMRFDEKNVRPMGGKSLEVSVESDSVKTTT